VEFLRLSSTSSFSRMPAAKSIMSQFKRHTFFMHIFIYHSVHYCPNTNPEWVLNQNGTVTMPIIHSSHTKGTQAPTDSVFSKHLSLSLSLSLIAQVPTFAYHLNLTLVYKLQYTLLTPWCSFLLEKLTGLQLVKKFPAFHGTRRFITTLTCVRHLSLSWGQPNPVHIPTSHLLEIHPNIIYSSTPRSPQWSSSPAVSPPRPYTPPSPHPYVPHAQSISFLSIFSPAQYWVRSTNHLAPRYAVRRT